MERTVNITQLLKIFENLDAGENLIITCEDMSDEEGKENSQANIDIDINPPLLRFNTAKTAQLVFWTPTFLLNEDYGNYSEDEIISSNLDSQYPQEDPNITPGLTVAKLQGIYNSGW